MVSVIDTEENLKKLLPALDEMVDEGLIAMSEVEVIRYVHQEGVRTPALYLDTDDSNTDSKK
jgi:hypothetical protein